MAEQSGKNAVTNNAQKSVELEQVVDSVMGSLDERRFSRLLVKSLLLPAVLFGVAAIIKGLIGLGLHFYPLVLSLIFS